MSAGSNILFKLSGSIAAWKARAVISQLVKDGHQVQAVATEAALRFIGPATLEGLTGRPVLSDLWARGAAMEHINLVKWADLTILCPATANTINRFAAGIADDLVGSLFLAHNRTRPYLVAPAMNPAMWAHPATAASVETLRSWGVNVLPVASGRLACGDEGAGRMIEPEAILVAIRTALAQGRGEVPRTSARLRVLVTSGGTEEPVDGVRSLGNFSSGRTGALIADTLAALGHEVTLLRGGRSARPAFVQDVRAYTAFSDLQAALRTMLAEERFDAVVHAAAVGDYAVDGVSVDGAAAAVGRGKIESGREVRIHLRPTPKLVDHLKGWSANPDLKVVAFKLTRGADEAAARAAVEHLFAHSGADAVVHNDLESAGAEPDAFPATLWPRGGEPLVLATRGQLARGLGRFLLTHAAEARPAAEASHP